MGDDVRSVLIHLSAAEWRLLTELAEAEGWTVQRLASRLLRRAIQRGDSERKHARHGGAGCAM